LTNQISTTTAHSQSLSEKLKEAHGQNVEYDRQLRQLSAELSTVKQQAAGLQEKLADADSELRHCHSILELVKAQKGEIEAELGGVIRHRREELSSNEAFVNSLAQIMSCDRSEVGSRIMACFGELSRLREAVGRSSDAGMQVQAANAQVRDLEARLGFASEQIESQNRQLALFASGQEGQVVTAIRSDFVKLTAVNTKLYEEHREQELRLVSTEAGLRETTANLESERKVNSELSARLDRCEVHEYNVRQLSEVLARLASQLVASLTNSVQTERMEVVEEMLVALRRETRADAEWERFGIVLAAAFADNVGQVCQMLQGRATAFAASMGTKMMAIMNRIAKQERQLGVVREKIGNVTRTLETRARSSPVRGARRSADRRSPLTPALAVRSDEMGVTPRAKPVVNKEPATKRVG
jgi:predicted  nucleic acid-binding Zn-ribbon protein